MIRRRMHVDGEPFVGEALTSAVRSFSLPLRGLKDLDPLISQIGDARFVLLGEASHGTHEFYAWRDALTRRLISEKGFSFVAVEGDWPDCYRVNRYVKAHDEAGETAKEVLRNFERWPTWMWANEEVVECTEWLRDFNRDRPGERRIGFYGLDVYSLWDSLYQVMAYLRKHDPSGLAAARQAFRCFEPYAEDVQQYARAVRWVNESCEDEVLSLLTELRRFSSSGSGTDREERFNADQNAHVLANAERYYRTMIAGGPDSWNIRDRHMTETLLRLVDHYGPASKAVVWEHNTHVGDARFTDMADGGMVNVGQLVREERETEGVFLVGFGTYQGTVMAGSEWDAPMQAMEVPPARPGSWEEILHHMGFDDRVLLFDKRESAAVAEPRGHRAIGVVYDPKRERYGNYVPTVLPRRYDAFLFLDTTEAVRPLYTVIARDEGEVPETFPSGV